MTARVRPRLFGASVLISATLLFSSQLALAQFSQQGSKLVYSYTTINDPQALAAGLTVANGINDAGEIVGLYADSSGYHGFLYSGGKYTTLNVPLAPYTYAYGINDKGQIVGLFGGYGFLYSDGHYTTLSDPQGQFTQAYGINDKGQIVGQFTDSSGTRHGFLYSDGKYTTIDDPLATNGTFARGINDKGQIVGQYIDSSGEHGFLYSSGKYTTINDPLATNATYARGINNRGEIGGLYVDGSGPSEGSFSHIMRHGWSNRTAETGRQSPPCWQTLSGSPPPVTSNFIPLCQ
jgi:probable HAF family extracellular repeat protein